MMIFLLVFALLGVISMMKALKLSASDMRGLIRHVESLNAAKNYASVMKPFCIENQVLGYFSPYFADLIVEYSDIFDVQSGAVRLNPRVEGLSLEGRTQALHKVNEDLRAKGVIKGWRDEFLAVSTEFEKPPVLLLERAAVPFYGTKAYGVHVNGFVRDQNKEISHLWVGTRSPTKQTWPNLYDHIVAGGLPHGISLKDNVIKECEEEASIPRELASQALDSGFISYNGLDEWNNLKRDVIFCYDLELPASFVPKPLDGEVESFSLKSIDWVLDVLLGRGDKEYKPNCNLVVTDFLIRHGFIESSSPHFQELKDGLRS